MTVITTTCRVCHREFAPTRASIAAGTWQVCPECRPAPDAGAGETEDPEVRSDG
jgi:hypothetical protein